MTRCEPPRRQDMSRRLSAWGKAFTTLLLTASQNFMDPSLEAVATIFPSELHRMLLIPSQKTICES